MGHCSDWPPPSLLKPLLSLPGCWRARQGPPIQGTVGWGCAGLSGLRGQTAYRAIRLPARSLSWTRYRHGLCCPSGLSFLVLSAISVHRDSPIMTGFRRGEHRDELGQSREETALGVTWSCRALERTLCSELGVSRQLGQSGCVTVCESPNLPGSVSSSALCDLGSGLRAGCAARVTARTRVHASHPR